MAPSTFTQALEHAAMLATQALPETLHERLTHAVALVRDGHCFQDDAGTWTVQSATTPDKRYTVNGSCECEDAFYRAPEGRCKHKLAQFVARKVAALMQVSADVTQTPMPEGITSNDTPPQPLYEAPASVSVHVTIAGRDVLVTLRDVNEGRLLERLAVVLAQYPAPKPPPRQSGPTQGQGAGWCAVHNVALHVNHGKDGRTWYSHKLPAGGFCKGKGR